MHNTHTRTQSLSLYTRRHFLCLYLSIYISTYLHIYTSIYLSINRSIYLSISLSVCVSIRLSIYLSRRDTSKRLKLPRFLRRPWTRATGSTPPGMGTERRTTGSRRRAPRGSAVGAALGAILGGLLSTWGRFCMGLLTRILLNWGVSTRGFWTLSPLGLLMVLLRGPLKAYMLWRGAKCHGDIVWLFYLVIRAQSWLKNHSHNFDTVVAFVPPMYGALDFKHS